MRESFEPPNFAPDPIATFAGESELKGCRAATRVPWGGAGEGLGVGLGYRHEGETRAPFASPVQLRLLGRRMDVEAGARVLVQAGRLADDLVAGIDPFR